MPALDYDYSYYEYRNGHRVNGNGAPTSTKRQQTTRSVAPATRARVTEPTKRKVNTQVTPRKQVAQTRRTPYGNATKTATRKTSTSPRRQKSSIDIPIPSSAPKIKNKPEEMALKKPKVASKTNSVSTMKTAALISVFFAMFFFICYRYSVLNEEFSHIKKLQSELAEAQAVNDQLQADIESKTDLTYVENYAKYQLGMQKPSSSQIQYVSVAKEDKITRPVTIDDEEECNWFDRFLQEIRKILD